MNALPELARVQMLLDGARLTEQHLINVESMVAQTPPQDRAHNMVCRLPAPAALGRRRGHGNCRADVSYDVALPQLGLEAFLCAMNPEQRKFKAPVAGLLLGGAARHGRAPVSDRP